MIVYIVWSVQHLCQQNVGLLLLYHNHGQNEAIVNRSLEVKSLQIAAVFFTLLFAQRIFLMEIAQSIYWRVLLLIIGIAFFTFILLYLRELVVQLRRGAYLNVSAFLFWCLGIYFFIPFAFLGKSYGDAILIANIMHWAQYIGIMYVLMKRKYQGTRLSDLPVQQPILLFFLFGIAMIALLDFSRALPTNAFMQNHPYLSAGAMAFVLGMGMVHYYQDAFMWRFREPYYRETVLSYLRSKG